MKLIAVDLFYIQEEMQYSYSLLSLEVKVETMVFMVN